jgi:hypothetical protein
MDKWEERRALRRTRVLRNAKIMLDHRSPLVSCTLLDLTSGGACLSLASTYRLPDRFELTFEQGRMRRPCRVVWRTANRLGVAFETSEAAAPADAASAEPDAT